MFIFHIQIKSCIFLLRGSIRCFRIGFCWGHDGLKGGGSLINVNSRGWVEGF